MRPQLPLILILGCGLFQYAFAADAEEDMQQALIGEWYFNASESDSTDRQVEKAMEASGMKVDRCLFCRDKERYRGGPEEQEMYDHISYDYDLGISMEDGHYRFEYNDGFTRTLYTDNRQRSISLSNFGEVEDFSLAHWEGDHLAVEGHPRDGGFSNEIYRLINNNTQLKAELYLQPRIFQAPVEITRIYDRVTP